MQQRGFAGAIATQHADALTGIDFAAQAIANALTGNADPKAARF
jgi:hypothetical protein